MAISSPSSQTDIDISARNSVSSDDVTWPPIHDLRGLYTVERRAPILELSIRGPPSASPPPPQPAAQHTSKSDHDLQFQIQLASRYERLLPEIFSLKEKHTIAELDITREFLSSLGDQYISQKDVPSVKAVITQAERFIVAAGYPEKIVQSARSLLSVYNGNDNSTKVSKSFTSDQIKSARENLKKALESNSSKYKKEKVGLDYQMAQMFCSFIQYWNIATKGWSHDDPNYIQACKSTAPIRGYAKQVLEGQKGMSKAIEAAENVLKLCLTPNASTSGHGGKRHREGSESDGEEGIYDSSTRSKKKRE
ncbi:hypothetical protein H0H93_010006 [Arthromyces matolae]|nr:hypothetical protein H0H93_010006 [Arthromyces matolae]